MADWRASVKPADGRTWICVPCGIEHLARPIRCSCGARFAGRARGRARLLECSWRWDRDGVVMDWREL